MIRLLVVALCVSACAAAVASRATPWRIGCLVFTALIFAAAFDAWRVAK